MPVTSLSAKLTPLLGPTKVVSIDPRKMSVLESGKAVLTRDVTGAPRVIKPATGLTMATSSGSTTTGSGSVAVTPVPVSTDVGTTTVPVATVTTDTGDTVTVVPEKQPFPWKWIIAGVVLIAAGVGLYIYFNKK